MNVQGATLLPGQVQSLPEQGSRVLRGVVARESPLLIYVFLRVDDGLKNGGKSRGTRSGAKIWTRLTNCQSHASVPH